jgi:hypothetical protein
MDETFVCGGTFISITLKPFIDQRDTYTPIMVPRHLTGRAVTPPGWNVSNAQLDNPNPNPNCHDLASLALLEYILPN